MGTEEVGVDDRGIGIEAGAGGGGEVLEGKELPGDAGPGVGYEAAPELALGEGFEVEAGYDAEVVGAAFEGFEEVGVGGGVGVDDVACSEDYLSIY